MKSKPVTDEEKLYKAINSWIVSSVKGGKLSKRKFNNQLSYEPLSPVEIQ